jgi:hypothetical protein
MIPSVVKLVLTVLPSHRYPLKVTVTASGATVLYSAKSTDLSANRAPFVGTHRKKVPSPV